MDNFINDKLPDSYAICLVGHGSREQEGNQEFLTLWKKLKERNFCRTTECGFLELGQPTLSKGMTACRQDGINNIIVLPAFLLPGEHTQRDIPNIIGTLSQSHPEIKIHFASTLGTKPEILKVCKERIKEAESFSPKSIPRSKSLFICIAHGSHDTNLNSEVEDNFNLLGKKLGFAKTVIHFAGTSSQSLEDVLDKFMTGEFDRVTLLPFFLFTGVWVKRVHALADTFQKKHQNTEFLKVSCLKHHELIVDALIHQAQEHLP